MTLPVRSFYHFLLRLCRHTVGPKRLLVVAASVFRVGRIVAMFHRMACRASLYPMIGTSGSPSDFHDLGYILTSVV